MDGKQYSTDEVGELTDAIRLSFEMIGDLEQVEN